MKLKRPIFWLISIPTMVLLFTGNCAKQNDLPDSEWGKLTPTLPNSVITTTNSVPDSENTSSPSSMPVIIPTLSMEDARLRLLKLLTNNGDCRLPCIWGITPGQSSIQDSKTILIPLSGISYYTNFGPNFGRVSPEDIEDNLIVSVRIGFSTYLDKNIINRVSFDVKASINIEDGYQDVFDSATFSERASYYMLSSILTEYGPPETIRIATQARESTRGNAGGGFHILLLYPDQGILALYTTQMQVIGSNVRGCPGNAHVQLDLYPPGQRDEFLDAFNEITESRAYPQRLLEDVTSLSLEEFYQTFRQSARECLETPASLWPIPE